MRGTSAFDEEIFATRLSPHRSLTPANFRVLLCVFAASCCVAAARFLLLGAWPVAAFFGLDVLIFHLAFRANFRAARAYEQYRLTVLELLFARVSAGGTRAEWRFNPSWVRIERQEHEDFGVQRLDLVSRGNRVEIAHFLGADQKAEFAEALSSALTTARRGPTLNET